MEFKTCELNFIWNKMSLAATFSHGLVDSYKVLAAEEGQFGKLELTLRSEYTLQNLQEKLEKQLKLNSTSTRSTLCSSANNWQTIWSWPVVTVEKTPLFLKDLEILLLCYPGISTLVPPAVSNIFLYQGWQRWRLAMDEPNFTKFAAVATTLIMTQPSQGGQSWIYWSKSGSLLYCLLV